MKTSVRDDKVDYARVSAPDQKLGSQFDALKQARCVKTFSDQVSGMKAERSGWNQLMAYVRPGDTMVLTELSRMSRSLMHRLEVVKNFEKQGVELISLREYLDTSTAIGRGFLAISDTFRGKVELVFLLLLSVMRYMTNAAYTTQAGKE